MYQNGESASDYVVKTPWINSMNAKRDNRKVVGKTFFFKKSETCYKLVLMLFLKEPKATASDCIKNLYTELKGLCAFCI